MKKLLCQSMLCRVIFYVWLVKDKNIHRNFNQQKNTIVYRVPENNILNQKNKLPLTLVKYIYTHYIFKIEYTYIYYNNIFIFK